MSTAILFFNKNLCCSWHIFRFT